MVYLPGVKNSEEAARHARAILDAIMEIKTESGRLSASIGVALYPQQGISVEDGLAECADVAMYRAKASGKNRFCIYNPSFGRKIKTYRRVREQQCRLNRFKRWLRGNRAYAAGRQRRFWPT